MSTSLVRTNEGEMMPALPEPFKFLRTIKLLSEQNGGKASLDELSQVLDISVYAFTPLAAPLLSEELICWKNEGGQLFVTTTAKGNDVLSGRIREWPDM